MYSHIKQWAFGPTISMYIAKNDETDSESKACEKKN
jgi:hypothetical protein